VLFTDLLTHDPKNLKVKTYIKERVDQIRKRQIEFLTAAAFAMPKRGRSDSYGESSIPQKVTDTSVNASAGRKRSVHHRGSFMVPGLFTNA
jgi:hypothetical protein